MLCPIGFKTELVKLTLNLVIVGVLVVRLLGMLLRMLSRLRRLETLVVVHGRARGRRRIMIHWPSILIRILLLLLIREVSLRRVLWIMWLRVLMLLLMLRMRLVLLRVRVMRRWRLMILLRLLLQRRRCEVLGLSFLSAIVRGSLLESRCRVTQLSLRLSVTVLRANGVSENVTVSQFEQGSLESKDQLGVYHRS